MFLTCLFREQGLKNTVEDKEFCFFPSFVFQGGRTGVVTGLYLFQVFHQKGEVGREGVVSRGLWKDLNTEEMGRYVSGLFIHQFFLRFVCSVSVYLFHTPRRMNNLWTYVSIS